MLFYTLIKTILTTPLSNGHLTLLQSGRCSLWILEQKRDRLSFFSDAVLIRLGSHLIPSEVDLIQSTDSG